MSSNNEKKHGRKSVCGHAMQSWDTHRFCPRCRKAGKCDDSCTLKKDCLLCIGFSEEQKAKIHGKSKKKGQKNKKKNLSMIPYLIWMIPLLLLVILPSSCLQIRRWPQFCPHSPLYQRECPPLKPGIALQLGLAREFL